MYFFRAFSRNQKSSLRFFSDQIAKRLENKTELSTNAIPSASSSPPKSSGGSTFIQRFTSFLTGCGVGFGLGFYFVYEELQNSNSRFEKDIKALREKLSK
jgi:hypothetical protein